MINTVSALAVEAEKCTSCGICVDMCPLDLLRFDENQIPFLKYEECWYCNTCVQECPKGAIRLHFPYLMR
jgi:NAD-dependent dihydropyrimidine dehydrogenase PreA subunit